MTKILAGDLDTHVQRLPPTVPVDGEAPVVVFIHGLLTDSLASYYFTLGPAFAAAGVDVVMYDLRGHGKSGRPATGYQLERFIADLVSLLDAMDITRPVHLVGNSFGGSIAFGLAAAHPDRVATVIAIEAEPPVRAWTVRMAEGLDLAKSQLTQDAVIDWIAVNNGKHTARLSRAAGRLLQVTSMLEDIPVSDTIACDTPRISAMRVRHMPGPSTSRRELVFSMMRKPLSVKTRVASSIALFVAPNLTINVFSCGLIRCAPVCRDK